jgi:hypothetical protein
MPFALEAQHWIFAVRKNAVQFSSPGANKNRASARFEFIIKLTQMSRESHGQVLIYSSM